MFAIEEFKKSKKNRIKNISYNPILFDATCSGLQHLSALTREMDAAVKTNLITHISNILNEKLNTFKNVLLK